MKKYLKPVLLIIFGIGIAFGVSYLREWHIKTNIVDFDSCVAAGYPVQESYPANCVVGKKSYTQSISAKPQPVPDPKPLNTNITVTFPQPNTQVSSPLTISGQAKGSWYFEASFPIKLYDANNTLLTQTTGQAQGNWMTTSFVPFTATLTFPTPSTTTGTLILEKDNPSGEPQNADSISIPITF